MKVCLIRPPKYMIQGTSTIPIIPPLGIALIAAVLERAGHEVTAIDAIAECPNQFQQEDIPIYTSKVRGGYKLISMGMSFKQILHRIPPDVDVIGISAMFSINWPLDRALMNIIGQHFPKALLIAGGESITGMAEICLKQVSRLSVCVLGEGEETVVELLSYIDAGKQLNEVAGIIFKDTYGNILKTNPRARLRKVDDVPYPAWHHFPIHNYQKHSTGQDNFPRITLSVLATRGCPYECTFCTSPDMWGTRYFMRKPKLVVDEIEYVKNTFGATNFEFFDLTAIVQKRWIIEFAKLLVERNLNITWKIPAGTRSEAIDEEVAYWLKKSGCYFITYAPESGSPRLLNIIKKKVSLPNILNSIKYAKKQGLMVYTNIIMGLPDETHADVWKTFLFMLKCRLAGVDDMPLAVFRPYPGSALFERLLREGKINLENDDYLIDSLFIIDTLTEHQYYNDNISPFAYRMYLKMAYLCFYGIDYLRNAAKILRTLRNISEKNYETELERKLISEKSAKKNALKPLFS